MLKNLKNERKNSVNFFLKRNFLVGSFNFLWKKNEKSYWFSDNRNRYKGTFKLVGPGLLDPFVDPIVLGSNFYQTVLSRGPVLHSEALVYFNRSNLFIEKPFTLQKFILGENKIFRHKEKTRRKVFFKNINGILKRKNHKVFPQSWVLRKKIQP